MNYKLRNFIGVVSFISILLIIINSQAILNVINLKILGREFVGVKDDKLYFSTIENNELSLDSLVNYVLGNLNEIDIQNLDKYKFTVYTKDINKEDQFVEKFTINIDEKLKDNLYKNIGLLDKNKELLLKFALIKDNNLYISDVFQIKIIYDSSQNSPNYIIIDKFSQNGITSKLELPKGLVLSNNCDISTTAKYEKTDVSGLSSTYDANTKSVFINNLVPKKQYSDINVSICDENGKTTVLKINKLIMEPESELQDYLVEIYLKVMKRYPTEEEYINAFNNLSNGSVTINDFLIQFISSNEFDTINTTPKQIIESIYFLTNKKDINSRLSIIILDEFNNKILNSENLLEVKKEILDRFLNMESGKQYMISDLKVSFK